MTRNSSLIVHLGGLRRTREELRGLHTPVGTPTWKPVAHADLVGELIRGLERQGVTIARDDYCTMGRDDARLLGTMNLRIPDRASPDYSMGLGLRGANDKSLSIQVVAAARVFVCDNKAFSGSAGAVFLREKPTSRLDLSAVVPKAIDQVLEKAGAFKIDLDRMRDFQLTDNRANELVHDSFAADTPVAPLRLFPIVSCLYFEDDDQRESFPDRSLWSLNNAFTEAVKALKQGPQHDSGLRIGRMFGRIIHRRIDQAEPVVIDGIVLN